MNPVYFDESSERLVKRVQRAEVKGFPIGMDAYHLNPFRILDFPISVSVTEMLKRLKKYKMYSMVGRSGEIAQAINFGREFRLSKYDIQEMQDKIDNPRAWLAYGIFWFDLSSDHYQSLSKEPQMIINHFEREINDNGSKPTALHSLAIMYHGLAIQNALDVFEGSVDPDFNLWEKAFDYWNHTLMQEQFWETLQVRIDSLTDPSFLEYKVESLREEMQAAILGSLLPVPLEFVELGKIDRVAFGYLKVLLDSSLGSSLQRGRLAANLVKGILLKRTSLSHSSEMLEALVLKGQYRDFYNIGMKLLNNVNKETESLETDSGIKISDLPEIHDKFAQLLLPAINSRPESDDEKILICTIQAGHVLASRLLTEFRLSEHLVVNIKKAHESSRTILGAKEISHDPAICYWVDSEYADPDCSICKPFLKATPGGTRYIRQVVIPRSRYAYEWHRGGAITPKGEKAHLLQELKEREIEQQRVKQQIEVVSDKLKILHQNQESEISKARKRLSTIRTKIDEKISTEGNRISEQEAKKPESPQNRAKKIKIRFNDSTKKKHAQMKPFQIKSRRLGSVAIGAMLFGLILMGLILGLYFFSPQSLPAVLMLEPNAGLESDRVWAMMYHLAPGLGIGAYLYLFAMTLYLVRMRFTRRVWRIQATIDQLKERCRNDLAQLNREKKTIEASTRESVLKKYSGALKALENKRKEKEGAIEEQYSGQLNQFSSERQNLENTCKTVEDQIKRLRSILEPKPENHWREYPGIAKIKQEGYREDPKRADKLTQDPIELQHDIETSDSDKMDSEKEEDHITRQEDEAEPTANDEWESRTLCRDESCIGVIGPDGHCTECGLIYNESDSEMGEDEIDGQEDRAESGDNDEWESRTLCRDESCIGVIGPDGYCKECGLRYQV